MDIDEETSDEYRKDIKRSTREMFDYIDIQLEEAKKNFDATARILKEIRDSYDIR